VKEAKKVAEKAAEAVEAVGDTIKAAETIIVP
jgi:hypothetical protein